MGVLKKQLAKIEKKFNESKPGQVDDKTLLVPTGMDVIDYACGSVNETDEGDYVENGIPMGKIIMYVGQSQSGKTTKAIQDAHKIAVDSGLNGDIIIADFERSLSKVKQRVMNITGCDEETFDDTYTIFRNDDLTTESLKEIICNIAEEKEAMGKTAMTQWYNSNGEEITIFTPTIVIIDSIPTMRCKELLEKSTLDSNMAGATIAKANSGFVKSILHLLERYNITIMGVGHITVKVNINPYDVKPPLVPGLKSDENIPGGNSFIYYASYIFKLWSGETVKADKGLYVAGRIVNCSILKTRSGFNNKRLRLVFTEKKAFSNVLTNFMTLKDANYLKGGGRAGFNIPALPEVKFTQKEFVRTYYTNEEFREAWDNSVSDYLTELTIGDKSGELYTESAAHGRKALAEDDFEE